MSITLVTITTISRSHRGLELAIVRQMLHLDVKKLQLRQTSIHCADSRKWSPELCAFSPSIIPMNLVGKRQWTVGCNLTHSYSQHYFIDASLLASEFLKNLNIFGVSREVNFKHKYFGDGWLCITIQPNNINVEIPILIIELKNEVGTGSSDSFTQGSVTYSAQAERIFQSYPFLKEFSCLPAFMLTMNGPWLCISGMSFLCIVLHL
jgi:hypothetical protein